MANQRWSPDSWRLKPVEQAPVYRDPAALAQIERQLGGYPPLVFAGEARKLKRALGSAAAGEAFMLQGGDCAESFGEHSADNIRDFFRVFLQMAVVMTFAAASPIVKVGRVAGQFAKPRSSGIETIDGVVVAELSRRHRQRHRVFRRIARTRPPPSNRGLSTVGGNAQPACARSPPAVTPTLRTPIVGCSDFVKDSPQSERYQGVADRITETLGFMRAIGLDAEAHPELRATDFYTSHEALLLGYEQALTRLEFDVGRLLRDMPVTSSGSATEPASLVERISSIAGESENPIGLKCGPSLGPEEMLRLVDVLDPDGEPGRLTLICRFGADKVEAALPPLLRAAKREGRKVLWVCDPMHGNTVKTSTGYKTRPTERIAQEVRSFFAGCGAEGVYAGGVHLEMTGKNVTECTGGARAISESDLRNRYHTYCDPRLNAEQSIELAFMIAELLKAQRLAQPSGRCGRRSEARV